MDWRALGTSFFLIFLAELVDMTAYTVLLLSTRSGPLPVLLGAWAAFLAQGVEIDMIRQDHVGGQGEVQPALRAHAALLEGQQQEGCL